MEKQCEMQNPNKKNWLVRFNPVLPKRWLLILAGFMWTCVGIMLLNYAVSWLATPFSSSSIFIGLLGLALSVVANRFQFIKLARKNVDRILALKEKACLFSFQAWKGYLIIAIMITTGILLRNSAIPRHCLAVLYTTIGGALVQASATYYTRFFLPPSSGLS